MYTKGEWKADGRNIITPTGEFKLVLINGIGLSNLIDNAHLIASAPDLLAACGKVRKMLGNAKEDECVTFGLHSDLCKARHILQQAISKSKGEV